ncbi:MAG TPA: hypothetical protein VD884_16570 [Ohtaekwangia sp.]|nr:hypothetical protein [Ohtaekwangia sp.]
MKKILFVLSFAGAALLSSCDNENSENPQPTGTATISGTVYAQFDYTNDDYETVANKKMIVAVWSDYTDSYRFTETSTDANGNYSIEIKVGNQPLGVELVLVDFKADVKDGDGTEEVIFYGNNFETGAEVIKGGEYIRDIYYND